MMPYARADPRQRATVVQSQSGDRTRIACIALVVVGIIGLKLHAG